jgi:hypothetical protein
MSQRVQLIQIDATPGVLTAGFEISLYHGCPDEAGMDGMHSNPILRV